MTTLADVLTIVGIGSVSRNESALCDHVVSRLDCLDHLEVVRVGDNVIARTTWGKSTRVLIAGHLDTVPGDANAARIDDEVLHGVGACDMKASVAVMLDCAADPTPLNVDLTWVFYAREEIARSESGLLEIASARPDLLVADVAVVGEPTDGFVEAGCQGTLRVAVTLRGRRAHVARAYTGRNAIHRLATLLERVAAYQSRDVSIDGCVYTEQLQAVDVRGGIASNVVPDSVTVVLNHRVAPDRDEHQALTWLLGLLGDVLEHDDEVRIEDWAPSAAPSLENEHLARLVQATGRPPRANVGWTDVATLQSLGIPATNYGAGDPLLAHRSDEFVTSQQVSDFENGLRSWLQQF